MTHLVKRLAQSPGFTQSAYTVVGNTFASVISGLALILLSRFLGPTQFGEFSVGFSLVLILSTINSSGFGQVLLKYLPTIDDHAQASRIISYTLKMKIIVSVFTVMAGFILTPWLVNMMHFSQPLIIYAAFPLTVIITFYEHLLAVLQSLHRFVQAVLVNVIQASTKLLIITILVVGSLGTALPAFILYMVAPLVAVLTAKWMLPKWLRWSFFDNHQKEQQLVASMARHAAVGFIITGLVDNVDVLFVRGYLNAYETGLLGGVSKIAMFLMLMAYSLGNVLYPRVARYQLQSDVRLYLKKAAAIALLAVAGFVAFIPFGKLAIELSIGREYLPGLPILLILMAAAFLTLVIVPFQALFYSYDAPWYFSVTGIMQLTIVLIGNGVFVPQFGLEAAAWTRFFSRLALAFFTVVVALLMYKRRYRVRPLT